MKLLVLLIVEHLLLSSYFSNVEGAVKLRRKTVINGITLIKEVNSANKTRYENGNTGPGFIALDILMVADYSLYDKLVLISHNDEVTGHNYAKEYLTAVYEQMRDIYDEQNFNGDRLFLRLAGTFVAIRPIDCPVLQPGDISSNEMESNATYEELLEVNNSTVSELKIDAQSAIRRFGRWVTKYKELLPKHDHAMLITNMDLLSPSGSGNTQGMAQLSMACQGGDSTSIIEDVGGMATAVIAAHELGHNIGAPHDGSTDAMDCDPNDNHLMAPTISGTLDDQRNINSRRLSNCSVAKILDYLKKPESECMKKLGRRPVRAVGANLGLTENHPGERFSASQQCQIAFGPNYGLCKNPAFLHLQIDPCRRIWCKDRTQPRAHPCETANFFPAFDGISCGMNKWCMHGNCVSNPKKMMECKDVNEKECREYTKTKLRKYCNSVDFKAICCYSCHKALFKESQLEKKL